MQLVDIKLGCVTVCLHHAQIRRLLACVREQACTVDVSDLELAFELMLTTALASDDLRTEEAFITALEDAR